MSVTHLAGAIILLNGRMIQRCSVCGEKLVDTKGIAIKRGSAGVAPRLGSWGIGYLVRVDEGSAEDLGPCPDNFAAKDFPDFCISLVEC